MHRLYGIPNLTGKIVWYYQIIIVILKLLGVPYISNWEWYYVLAPLILVIALPIIIYNVAVIGIFIAHWFYKTD